MAEPNEPKKETVRIAIPPSDRPNAADPHDDAVRINAPERPPKNGQPAQSPNVEVRKATAPLTSAAGNSDPSRPPLAKVPTPPPLSSSSQVESATASSGIMPPPAPSTLPRPPLSTAPKTPPAASAPASSAEAAPIDQAKEGTAPINVLRDAPKPSVKMTKTQPLITVTAKPVMPPAAPLSVAPVDKESVIDSIPLPLCWALVGISSAILLMEIWTYIS